MKHVKFLGFFLVTMLVGAGCGGGIITDHSEDERVLVLTGEYTMVYPETYTLTKVEGVDRLSDGECLVFLRSDSNTLVGPGWNKQSGTERLGELTYNMDRYQEGGHQLRVDAHLVETNIHLSLDNPSGFARCVDELEGMLKTVTK